MASNENNNDDSTTLQGIAGDVGEDYNEEEVLEEIVDEGFLYLDYSEDGLSDEENEVNQVGNLKWKDLKLSKSNVTVNLGDTADRSWEQAIAEINGVYEMLFVHTGSYAPSLIQCIALLYGEHGRIYEVFKRFLKWPYSFFRSFLATLSFQHSLNLSATAMYGAFADRISKRGLLTKKEFVGAWQSIGTVGLGNQHGAPNVARQGNKPFWQSVQEAFNETYRELFVKDYRNEDGDIPLEPIQNILVIDDFKMYYVSKNPERTGLRISQHTRANRRGPVMHQMVRTASGILIGIYFEKIGDSERSAVAELIRSQFFPSSGERFEKLDLYGLEIAADRGYTKKQTVESIIYAGGEINGTKAMTLDCPFVFGKKLREGDNRTELDKYGAKTLWIKRCNIKRPPTGSTVKKKELFIHAYRNNSNITLGVTTKFKNFEWEFVLQSTVDLDWYESEVFKIAHKDELSEGEWTEAYGRVWRRCFPSVVQDQIALGFAKRLVQTEAHPLTTTQRTADWFFLRSFSCTSRSVYSMVHVFLKATRGDIVNLLNEFSESHDITERFEYLRVLQRVLGLNVMPPLDDNTEEESQTEPQAGPQHSTGPSQREPTDLQLDDVIGEDANTDEFIEDFDRHEKQLSMFAKRLGHKNPFTQKLSEKWLKSPFQMRHAFFQKEQLVQKYNTIPANFKVTVESHKGPSIKVLRAALLKYYEQNPTDDDIIPAKKAAPRTKGTNQKLLLDQNLTKSLLQSTFMRKIEGQGREWARRGTNNEEPLAKLMFRDLKDGKEIPSIKLFDMCHAPLVEMNREHDQGFMKCSADFICWGSYNDKQFLMGVEVKTRVTETTRTEAMDIHSRNQVPRYFEIDWDDNHLQKFVTETTELIQLLHCATVYNIQHWMLLIGSERYVISGIIVKFPHKVRAMWFQLCHSLWAKAKDPMSNEQWNNPKLLNVLKEIKLSGGATLDVHSLQHHWYLYKAAIETLFFPLPPCTMLVPKFVAHWNANKSGSDTRSKLSAGAEYIPPSKLIQANVVALMLGDGLTSIHRLIQIATAKRDLEESYPSLAHFRNAANRRLSYKETLMRCANVLSTQKYKVPNLRITGLRAVTPRETNHRTTRNSKEFYTILAEDVITGITPQRKCAEAYERLKHKPEEQKSAHENYILERRENCTGHPIVLDTVPKGVPQKDTYNKRGTCFACGKDKAQIYCLGCHSYYHMSVDGGFDFGKRLEIKVLDSNKSIFPKLTCYNYCHPAAFGDKDMFNTFNVPPNIAQAKATVAEELDAKHKSSGSKRKHVSFRADEEGQDENPATDQAEETPKEQRKKKQKKGGSKK